MKTAVVTGGTRGIGFGIANSLARDGYDLILGYHADTKAAEGAQKALSQEHGRKVVCVPGDIAQPSTLAALFTAVKEHFNNELTAFVHNAGLYLGITTDGSASQPKPGADFEASWDYYQKVYPRAFKRALAGAMACKGLRHICATSSPGCNISQPPQTDYEMPGQAKASMEFLVRLHAVQLAAKGINVNCVIPGFVKTHAWDRVVDKAGVPRQAVEAWVSKSPAGTWGSPSQIGDAVAFLCSERGAWVTGVALPVDGGFHLAGTNRWQTAEA